jgi:hypothetical protein
LNPPTPINLENKAASIKVLQPISKEEIPRPKLTASIKLDILEATKLLPQVDPAIISETADVLEELLQAVESGHKGPHLPVRVA